jgi:hypothetical protein
MFADRPRLDLAVCCLLLGGAAAHVAHLAFRAAPAETRPNQDTPDDPGLLGAEEIASQYGLRAVPLGEVVTDLGRPLRAEVATQPWGVPGRAADVAAVRRHLREADLVRVAPPGGASDCHGWVFLGGRGWLAGEEVEAVLRDNGYYPVAPPQPGDLVVYRGPAGVIRHSGVVVGLAEGGVALVESKWGDQGRYIHRAELPGYGRHGFYRSYRRGHRVRGWERLPAARQRGPAQGQSHS